MKSSLKNNVIIIAILVIMFAIFSFVALGNPQSIASASNEEIYYGTSLSTNSTRATRVETEIINYAKKEESSYQINESFPFYYNRNSALTNSCANVAGANIVGFYDRYFDELIPNCTVGVVRRNKYTYYNLSMIESQVQTVINDLYKTMKTNISKVGTTKADYLSGLATYVSQKGRQTTSTSLLTNGKFDLNKAIAKLKENVPISLFLSGYNIVQIEDSGTQIKLNKSINDLTHIMIVYGYKQVKYYNANGSLVKTKIYLNVASGLNPDAYYYIVDNNGNMDDIVATQIY